MRSDKINSYLNNVSDEFKILSVEVSYKSSDIIFSQNNMYRVAAYEIIHYSWQFNGSTLVHNNSYEINHNIYLSYNNAAAVWKVILDENDDSFILSVLPTKDLKAADEDIYIKPGEIVNKDSFYYFMDEYMKLRHSSFLKYDTQSNINLNLFTSKITEEEQLRKNAIWEYMDKMGITIIASNNYYSISEIKRVGSSFEVTLYETIKYDWKNAQGQFNSSSGLYVQHKLLFEYIEMTDVWVILSDKYDESYAWGFSTYKPIQIEHFKSNIDTGLLVRI